MNSTDIELALSKHFNIRVNIIVPNISWGFNIHECDLLVISKRGYLTEVEIKTSVADLQRDLKKWHAHQDHRIKNLFFAMPESMREYSFLIPKRAGILLVRELASGRGNIVIQHRQATENQSAKPISVDDKLALLRLGQMRTWTLKRTVRDRCRDYQELAKRIKEKEAVI